MMLRISASILLLFSILFMPFWVSAILALGAMFYFDVFWEAVFLFFLSDLLYGIKEAGLYNLYFISFILSALVLILLEFTKRKLKFYSGRA